MFILYVIFHTNTYISTLRTNTASAITPSSVNRTNTNVEKTTFTTNVKKTMPSTQKKTPMHALHTRKGPYVDGIYTGPLADAYYERIQVKVVIKDGVLTKVSFLPFQVYNGTSQAITGYAMPRLRLEALTIQKANVNTISGATEISNAFRTSLSNALLKAT